MIVDEFVSLFRREAGGRLRSAIAGDERLAPEELSNHDDLGLFGPASVAWRIHGDSAMLIGGLRALLLQTLHPLAMAGVADHSDYRNDPWGRLHRTGRFIGATTFGTTATAETTIESVRRIHDRVTGEAPDGRPYSANDPHLLLWVHLTEVDSFLAAYERYGNGKLTDAEKDRYLAEMAQIATRLGAGNVPTNRAELTEALTRFQPECSLDEQAAQCVRFLLLPPVPLMLRASYGLISAAAVGSLPPWARSMLRLPMPPGLDPVAIRPAASFFIRSIGWLMADTGVDDANERLLVD